jgi:hypothetical protein
VGLDGKPIGVDETTERACESDDDDESDREIANHGPATSIESFCHDRAREDERTHERDPPEGRCPAEHGDQCLLDIVVLGRGRVGDRGPETDGECPERKEDAIDRSTVPPAGLGRREQRQIPRTFSRGWALDFIGGRCRHAAGSPNRGIRRPVNSRTRQ